MSTPGSIERRSSPLEYRAHGRRLEGYAAVFGVRATIGSFDETIRAGAFRATLAAAGDRLALLDHDPAKLLARTANGSLHLSEDTRGLAFDMAIPNTTLGNDVLAMAEAGLLGGMSFGFRATNEAWPAAGQRELRAVHLAEISVVQAFPAYDQTSVSARFRAASVDPARVRRLALMVL